MLYDDNVLNLYETENENIKVIQTKENNYKIEGVKDVRIFDSFDFNEHLEIVRKNVEENKKENGIIMFELILKNKKFKLKSSYKIIIMQSIYISIYNYLDLDLIQYNGDMINPQLELIESDEEQIIKKRNYIAFCRNIQKDLFNLENDKNNNYIPFPDYSIFTSLIHDSLLGNCYNSFITYVSTNNIDLCVKLFTISSFFRKINVYFFIIIILIELSSLMYFNVL